MNYFNLVGMYVTSKTGQEGIVKSVEKKGDKYFLHLIKKHGYAWFEISLLNGAYQYKNINGYDYDELEDLFANCIEGEVSNIAISILKENQELKKQLKNMTNDYCSASKLKHERAIKIVSMDNQQREFIKYLEDEISKQKNDIFINALTSEDIDLYMMKIKLQKLEKILQKYKEIIGDDK